MDTRRSFCFASRKDDFAEPAADLSTIDSTDIPYVMPANDNAWTKDRLSARCGAAADQGYVDAEFNLAFMYKNGLGVSPSYVQAHMWLGLAATAGDKKAAENRDIVARLMTTAEIAEARKLAQEWKPKLAQEWKPATKPPR